MKFASFIHIFMLIAALTCPVGITVAQTEYMIGEGDLLRITVYDHPDLTFESRVSGEGRIAYPLIGEIEVTGISSFDLEKKIARLLEDGYIIKPQVSVFIEEYKSKKVTVLGEVGKPGLVILRGESTLLQVISDAGGITVNAGEALTIQRKNKQAPADKADKQDILLTVSLKKLFEEGDVTANVAVIDGDSIYVPRAPFVYVNGEVRSPGAYKITKGLTVLKSITLAGGFTVKSSERRTKIIRNTEKGEVKIPAKMDDLVMPDDIIFVPESFF